MRPLLLGTALPFVVWAIAAVPGCGSGESGSQFSSQDGGHTDGATSESSCGLGCGNDVNLEGPWNDFPASPLIDMPDGGMAAPGNSPSLFGPPSQGAQSGGPCLLEPEVGSLYPHNWLRPRFHWIAANGENLFELRVHADNQVNDLVVYTAATTWTMPKPMWDGLRGHSADVPMTVAVRGGVYGGGGLTGEALGSNGPIGIAPVDAPGTIVYWSIVPGPKQTSLKGFSIGDEVVTPVLDPSQVQEFSTNCIGCHTSTPDGKFAAFSSSSNSWQDGLADIEQGLTGQVPSFLAAGGKAALEQSQMGIETFSPAHWAAGDHIEIVKDTNLDLTWIDLEAPSGANATGVIARNGDANHAGAPTWSHDGSTIVYVSTNALQDGRLSTGPADLYSVPYNNKQGGMATPVQGASDPNYEEYYPVFSPDDQWLAFDRIAVGNSMYNQPIAEVYAIPSKGGMPTRLVANDPPACTSKSSPGVTNSWPKWAPSVATAGTRTFYWVVFSSTRDEGGNPQLYVTPLVVDGSTVTTYHALYLWNQPPDENNHTPAWDVFKIPPPPVQ